MLSEPNKGHYANNHRRSYAVSSDREGYLHEGIAGWSVADHMCKELCIKALDNAVKLHRLAPGLIHHSDRSSQYCSHKYQEKLAEYKMRCSMSRKGNCWDNA